MRAKGVPRIYCVMNLAQGHLFGFAIEQRAAVGPAQRGNESGFLEIDQDASNHDGIRIDGLGQPGRGTAIRLLQCEHGHHMHRKRKSAALHAMIVTKLITFIQLLVPVVV